jgi:hypothetical protein
MPPNVFLKTTGEYRRNAKVTVAVLGAVPPGNSVIRIE